MPTINVLNSSLETSALDDAELVQSTVSAHSSSWSENPFQSDSVSPSDCMVSMLCSMLWTRDGGVREPGNGSKVDSKCCRKKACRFKYLSSGLG